jgi:hypothetical protein
MTLPLYSPLHTPLRSPLRSPKDYKWSAEVAPGVIHLSNTEIDDDLGIAGLVGVLTVTGGTGTYTYSITADPDSKFVIDQDRLELEATVDAAVDTTHSVTVEADNGVTAVLSRQFTIVVSEPGLDALSLSNLDLDENSAFGTVVGALSGMTTGSTLSMFDSAGTRFTVSGSNVVASVTPADYSSGTSHEITVRETLDGSPNSPRDTVFTITINNVAPLLSLLTVSPVGPGYTTATVSVDTTDGDGTIYFVVVPTAEAAPNSAQIVAGQRANGTAATWANNVVVSGIDTYMSGPTGLTAAATYDCYAIHYDGEGTGSNIATVEFTQQASSTPAVGNPMGLLLTLTYAA